MSAARQRVLRLWGCTGGGNSPNAVHRHTVRSLIDNRLATSRTVRRSGVIARVLITMSAPRETSLVAESGTERILRTSPSIMYTCICFKSKNQPGDGGREGMFLDGKGYEPPTVLGLPEASLLSKWRAIGQGERLGLSPLAADFYNRTAVEYMRRMS
jgi:hypothetical protein